MSSMRSATTVHEQEDDGQIEDETPLAELPIEQDGDSTGGIL